MGNRKNGNKALGNDPLGDSSLFKNPDTGNDGKKSDPDKVFSEVVTTEKLQELDSTLTTMKREVRKLKQRKENRTGEYMRQTFIIRRDLMEKLRDYCYLERISQKEGLERALLEFMSDKEDYLKRIDNEKRQ